MPINEIGRQQLILALRASTYTKDLYPKYDQNDFGDQSCGSVCCMAGFALYLKIGPKEWNNKINSLDKGHFFRRSFFHRECTDAGIELLGLNTSTNPDITPRIFSSPRSMAR